MVWDKAAPGRKFGMGQVSKQHPEQDTADLGWEMEAQALQPLVPITWAKPSLERDLESL